MNRTKEIITRLRSVASNTSCNKTAVDIRVIANELEYQMKLEDEKDD